MEQFINPFDEILKIDIPYPTFSDGEDAAYWFICNHYKYNAGIRVLYMTSDVAVLLNLITMITDMPVQSGPGFSETDFTNVVAQLKAELIAASNVTGYFNTLTITYLQCFSVEAETLNTIIASVGLSDTPATPITGLLSGIVQNVASTLVGLIPGVGSVLAGVMQTTIQAVQDGLAMHGPQPPDVFDTTVSGLWDTLSKSFSQLSTNIVDLQEVITANWGQLSKTSELMYNNGSNSVFFSSIETQVQLTLAAKAAYAREILKMLLPINYAIYQAATNGDGFYAYLSDEDYGYTKSFTLNPSAYTPTLTVPTIAFNASWANMSWIYWIAKRDNSLAYLDSKVIYNLINQNKDVFFGTFGWNMLNTSFEWTNALTIRIANNTPSPLSIGVTWSKGGIGMYGSGNITAQPFSTYDYIGCTPSIRDGDAVATFIITGDGVNSDNIIFQAKLNPANIFSAGTTVITQASSDTNCFALNTDCNGATIKGDTGGGAILVINPGENYVSTGSLKARPYIEYAIAKPEL